MNDETKSIWKKPLVGRGKWLGWSAILGMAFLATLCWLVLTTGNDRSTSGLVAVALAVAALATVFGLVTVRVGGWLCDWRNLRRVLFAAACLGTLVAALYAWENWRGKRAWQNYKHEWEAKGVTFTVASLIPPPVPDEKNFALTPLLRPPLDFTRGPAGIVWRDTNALARLKNLRADVRPDRMTNDNLALGNLDQGTLADVAACREFYRDNTNYPQPVTPGKPAEDILVALGKFDLEMRELREAAAARPLARFPVQYDQEPIWSVLLPHLVHVKGLCSLTQMRAVAELELSRSADALDDLKLGFRLSDSLREEPILIDHLVRVATLAINLQTVREGLARHAWTDAQLEELEKYLAGLDLLSEYERAMHGEMVFSVASLDYLRRQGFGADPMNQFGDDNDATLMRIGFNGFPSGWYYRNMLTVVQAHQDFLFAAVDERAHRVFPDVSDRLDSALAAMRTGPYTLFAKRLLPALGKAIRKTARMQVYVDAAQVACALERYRLTHGQLPDSLEALAPHFFERVPCDIVDGKPLRYRRNTDGGYVLYSVGWNMADDGGELAWTKGKKSVVDVARGDWVWSGRASQ